MSDRIVLANLRLEGRHGWYAHEREGPQPFEVDVELAKDLRPAGRSDDLADTIDYARAYDLIRDVVETRSFGLLEAMAETIASELLSAFRVDEVTVRVRKPTVLLGGPLDFAGVEIRRARGGD
jgi:7,8-dihydroneopterin aldolase/epimerase/oxygenase